MRLRKCRLKGRFLPRPNVFLFFPYVVVGLFLCKASKHYFLAFLHFGCFQIRRKIMPSKIKNNWITIARINWPVHVKAFRVNKKNCFFWDFVAYIYSLAQFVKFRRILLGLRWLGLFLNMCMLFSLRLMAPESPHLIACVWLSDTFDVAKTKQSMRK